MSFPSEILFEYMHDGWMFKGVKTWDNRFLVMRKNPRKKVWHTVFLSPDEKGLDKYKNRLVHPVRG